MPPRTMPCTLLLFLALILIPAVAAEFPFRRAVYRPWNFAVDGSWNFTVLHQLGIDGFYALGDWTWEKSVPGWTEERYGGESMLAAASNISFIAGQYYQQPSWQYIDFNYSHAVDEKGNAETYTPAPVDGNWWQHMMMEPAVFIANLSLHYPISALVWDMELYYSSGYHPRSYSYDEGTLRGFAEAVNVSIPSLAPTGRYNWLSSNSLLDEYQAFQEDRAFEMAREVRDAVHAINPRLDLGILGFVDCWFHWNILKGFNSSTSYVSAWYEGTYRQYITEGPDGVDHFHSIWSELGLNGKFLPGIWLLSPWGMVTEIEAAIRHNGAVWIYQRDGSPPPEYEEALAKAYGLIHSFIFFNGTEANPIPAVELPGIMAKPYEDVDGTISMLLSEYEYALDPPSDLVVFAADGQLSYAGENLTLKAIAAPNLTLAPGEVPCLVSGLSADDLSRTHALAILQQLGELIGYSRGLGLAAMAQLGDEIEAARAEYDRGAYDEVIARLSSIEGLAYDEVLQACWPIVQEGMANPRQSRIPLALLNRFTNAKKMLDEGRGPMGRLFLFSGVKEWYLSVDEGRAVLALTALAGSLFAFGRRAAGGPPPRRHNRFLWSAISGRNARWPHRRSR